MTKRAYISVYDKEGLVDYAKTLIEQYGYEIVSSGATFQFLKDSGVKVVNSNKLFNKKEVFSGMLSAFNEELTAGVIYDENETKQYINIAPDKIKKFDLVVINIKPFDELAADKVKIEDAIKEISISDCCLLRAAAMNYKNVTCVCDKNDYYTALNANEHGRLKLALKAFSATIRYDRLIHVKFTEYAGGSIEDLLNFEKLKDLPYGENPHQKASLYRSLRMIDYNVINNRELTFNNIMNLTEVMNIISEFYDVSAVAIVRHAAPCGVALAPSIYEAYNKAFDSDPISSYFGTIGFSQKVDYESAKHINSMAVKAIIAPDFDEKVVSVLMENSDIKLIKLNTPLKDYRKLIREDLIITPFGTLVQEGNNSDLHKHLFKVVTKTRPTVEQIEDAIFAWKVVKYAKTNSAVIAKDLQTVAISQGQSNAILAVELALNTACDNSKEAVLASDEAIPAEDCIYAAAQARISTIIQPGGSLKDRALIELADKYNIAMITTGIRNFRH